MRKRQRPVVEGFDVFDRGPVNERRDQTVDKTRVNILDVRINVDDDIALELIDRLPQIFALPAFGARLGQDGRGEVYIGAERGGDLARFVLRARVNDNDFIQQRVARHQFGPEDDDFLTDGLFLIQGRDAERYLQPLLLLLLDEVFDIPERRMMERVLRKPLVNLHRRTLRQRREQFQ